MTDRTPGETRDPDPTRAHYDALLAPIYRWMLGDWEQALGRSRDELRALGVEAPRAGARALDLGAGPGLHAIPLAELGYRVTAVDTSRELLAALSAVRPEVEIVVDDLVAYAAQVATGGETYDLVVCMGDTLTHLHADEDVRRALTASCRALRPGGRLLLTFRDYIAPVRASTDRFILVRGEAERILTCCLDYGAETVRVTDVVHERRDGRWTMRASAYPKLRLSPERVSAILRDAGAIVERCDRSGGRIVVVAKMP